jgi:F0F1-type ATP synthase delta subunit
MSISEIISKYSKALVSAIRKKQFGQKGLQEIDNIIKYIDDKQVKEKLLNPFWSAKRKCGIFSQLNLSPLMINFIDEVIKNKRGVLLDDILKNSAIELKPIKRTVLISSSKVNNPLK